MAFDHVKREVANNSALLYNPDPIIGMYSNFNLAGISNTQMRQTVISTYERMLLDDRIAQCIDMVNCAIKGLRWEIETDNPRIKDFTEGNLKDIDFSGFLSNSLTARAFGYALFEEIWKRSGGMWTISEERLIDWKQVQFEHDVFGDLIKVRVNQIEYPLDYFHIFTYPYNSSPWYTYGRSELSQIYREWYDKSVITKYMNIGLENHAFPLVVATYDDSMYKPGSTEKAALDSLLASIMNDARISIPGTRDVTGGSLVGNIKIDLMNTNFAGASADGFVKVIMEKNKAISRNLGLPDDIGYTDTSTGSRAKAIVESSIFWEGISGVVQSVTSSIQRVVDRLVKINFGVYPAVFKFDLATDKGLTQEKANIVKTLKETGISLTPEKTAEYLDLEVEDIIISEVKQPTLPMDGFTRHERFTRIDSVVNYKRIEKALDAMDDAAVIELNDAVKLGVDRFLKKYSDATKATVANFDGDAKGKMRRAYRDLCLAAYFTGKEEAISELELKAPRGTELFASQIVSDEEYESDAEWSYIVKNWIEKWEKRTGHKLSKKDIAKLKTVKGWAFVGVENLTGEIQKIVRDNLHTQVDYLNPDAITAKIKSDLTSKGLMSTDPKDANALYTKVRTSSNQYFNDAKMSTFTDPDVAEYIPAFELSVILDGRESDFCKAHSGQIIKASNPLLPLVTPPNHYNERSMFIPVTVWDGWDGIETWTAEPMPDPGFGG